MKRRIKLSFGSVIIFFIVFPSVLTAQSGYSEWFTLDDNFEFRVKCDYQSYNQSYKTWFEFKRSDDPGTRGTARKYGHVLLYIEGYEKTVKCGIGSDGDGKGKVWHSLPFDFCNSSAKYTFKTGFSQYSNSSSILK